MNLLNLWQSTLHNPILMAAATLLPTWVVSLLWPKASQETIWNFATLGMLIYMLWSAVALYWAYGWAVYLLQALGGAAALFLLAGMWVPVVVRWRGLPGSGESAMALLVLMYYPVLLGIVAAIRYWWS